MLRDELVVTGVAGISVLLLVGYAPIILYYYHQYRVLQKNIIFRKRYAEIVSMEVLIGFSKIIIGSLIYISLLLWYDQHKYEKHRRLSIQFNILIATDYIITFILFYLWIWRFWLLHFGIHFNIAITGNEWKFVINHSHKDHKTDWYLNKRDTFGNKRYIRNRFVIPGCLIQCILIIIPQFISSYYNTAWWIIYHSLHLFVPFCVLIIIYYKTCKFSDNFYITKEIERIFIFLCTAYSIMFIANMIEMRFSLSSNIGIILFCIQMNIIWFGQFASIITAIYWVPKMVMPLIMNQKYQIRDIRITKTKQKQSFHEFGNQLSPEIKRLISPSAGSQYENYYDKYYDDDNDNDETMEYVQILIMDKTSINKSIFDKEKRIKLHQVLRHNKGFDLFINHLATEFSVECLLSLVEMIQFQQSIYQFVTEYYIKYGDIDQYQQEFKEFDNSLFHLLEFPEAVPQSAIVYGTDYMKINTMDNTNILNMIYCYKMKAYDIYKKYIDYNSVFQINIPFQIRQEINFKLNDYDLFLELQDITLFHLVQIFESACNTQFKLMQSSYDRFCYTASYEKLRDCMFLI